MLLYYSVVLLFEVAIYSLLWVKLSSHSPLFPFVMFFFFPAGIVATALTGFFDLRCAHRITIDEKSIMFVGMSGRSINIDFKDIEFVGEKKLGSSIIYSELIVKSSSGDEVRISWDMPLLGEVMEQIIANSANLMELRLAPQQIGRGAWKKEPDVALFAAARSRAEENRKQLPDSAV